MGITNDTRAVTIDPRMVYPKTVASFVRVDSSGTRIPDGSTNANVPFNIADGQNHPISTFVGTGKAWADLAAVQLDYPHVSSTADELAWAAIQAAINALSPQPVVLLRGRYRLNRTLTIYNGGGLIGHGFGIDDTIDATVIDSEANPILYVSPYPGTTLQDLHIRGGGTTSTIDTWDVAGYTSQIGVWAGKTDGVITIAGGDGYGVGGSGALFMERVAFSGALGRAFYAYKLWGQSTLRNLHFYHVGTPSAGAPVSTAPLSLPDVGTPPDTGTLPDSSETALDFEHHGAMTFHGECADINIGPVHIIGDSTGYGIQLGANKSETDALDRFYVPPTHHRFSDVFVEGTGLHAVRQYGALRSTWSKCFFGGSWQDIEIGENPYVSSNNNETSWTDCGSFALGALYLKAERTNINDWHHESGDPLPVYYFYSAPTIRGKNLALRPSGNKAILYGGGNDTIINRPLAITDGGDSTLNLCPLYSSSAWTATPIVGDPAAAYMVSPVQYRLYGDGTLSSSVSVSISGLVADSVYTVAFKHVAGENPAYRSANSYKLTDDGGVVILENLVGYDETTVTGVATYILFQFVAPSSGSVVLTFYNSDLNQCYFWLPKVIPGAAHYCDHLRELFACDPHSNTVSGYPIGTVDSLHYGQNLTTVSGLGAVASLVSTSAVADSNRIAGLGANARFDGANWRTGDDAAGNNGGAVIATAIDEGDLRIYVIGQNGARGQTLTPAELEDGRALTVNADRTIDAVNDVRMAARARVGGSGAPSQTLHVESSGHTQVLVKAGPSDGSSDALVYITDASGNLLCQILKSGQGTYIVSGTGTMFQVIGPSPTYTPYLVVQDSQTVVAGLQVNNVTAERPLKSNLYKQVVAGKISLGSTDEVAISGTAGSLVKIKSGGALEEQTFSGLVTAILADTTFQNGVDTRTNTIINNLLSNGTLVGSSAIGVSIAAHPHYHSFSVSAHDHGGVMAGTDSTSSGGGDSGTTGSDAGS